jgi:hypothetical protein
MNSVPTIYISPDKSEIDLLQQPTEWVKINKAKKTPPLFSSSNINLNSSNSESVDSLMSSPSPKRIKTEQTDRSNNINSVRILNGSVCASKDLTVRGVKKNPPSCRSDPCAEVLKVSEENYRIQIQNKASTSKAKMDEEIVEFTPIEIDSQDIVFGLDASTSRSNIKMDKSLNDSSSEDLKPMLLNSLKQMAEIKEMLNEKQSEKGALTPPQKNLEDCSNISRSQLNKVQLFNGIKRYLSPSLIALLRMELFGNPGREYKKDEKIICQELMQLGDNVYNFFTDEWRIRLPDKKDVQKWHDEQLTEEDDDAS